METKEKVNGQAVKADNKSAQFVANNPVNKVSVKEEPKKEETAEPGKGAEAVKTEAPKTEVKAEPKAEPAKTEVKQQGGKAVMNLEGTLKLVEELHRRAIQRNKLLSTISSLEAFEIELKEEADETDTNYYNGCVLVIEDDNRNKFSTKNPVIIWTVAQMVNSLCVDKLAEIEAGITIPA
jgi:hypothetical protein